MIDEPGQVSALGCVHHAALLVDPEQVGRSDALLFVALLPHVGQQGSHHFADVLDHHLVLANVLLGKESPVVDGRLAESHVLSTEL